MKTIVTAFCILGISATVLFTNIGNQIYELVDSTNNLINLNKQSDIKYLEDHITHNDVKRINGKMLCEKTQTLYSTD